MSLPTIQTRVAAGCAQPALRDLGVGSHASRYQGLQRGHGPASADLDDGLERQLRGLAAASELPDPVEHPEQAELKIDQRSILMVQHPLG